MIDAKRSHKTCSVCSVYRARDDYYVNASSKDGMSSMCKDCQGLFSAIRLYAKMDEAKLTEEQLAAERKLARIQQIRAGVQVADIVRAERKEAE